MPHKLINGERVACELPETKETGGGAKSAAGNSRPEPAGKKTPPAKAKKLSLTAALKSLDIGIEAHWTKTGLPDLNALSELTGKKLTRADVEKCRANRHRKDAQA
ncbi:MAG: hypothetical protein DI551_00680 [Micavibrio aeruginosavorus]|uniref:Uncharacterized protein n=1 Tax=Micavibrio aeruginosavorus TaxID=349221 RepID=A0A2W5N8L8_9BACT|nr:MAG: hypothetical protein DI551_00680 [Micavibrio aeruginosavorus]